MPVVRRADFDGVDVVAAQDFAEIDVGVAAAVSPVAAFLRIMLLDQPPGRLAAADLALPVAGALAVDVADGDDLHAVIPEKRLDVVEALVARADDPQGDPIAGRGRARQPRAPTRGRSWETRSRPPIGRRSCERNHGEIGYPGAKEVDSWDELAMGGRQGGAGRQARTGISCRKNGSRGSRHLSSEFYCSRAAPAIQVRLSGSVACQMSCCSFGQFKNAADIPLEAIFPSAAGRVAIQPGRVEYPGT